MDFIRLVDTDNNEHYVRYSAIVDVRTTMSGGAFVDVAGLESPIFVRKDAKDLINEIIDSQASGSSMD